jgi:4-hydroxy-tetrahydrodipicolinate reductase
MLRYGLIGYGRMGKEIQRLASEQDTSLQWIYDSNNPQHDNRPNDTALSDTDVIIEFTIPDAVLENIRYACSVKKNIIVGTTGWYDKIDEVRGMVEAAGIGLFYAQNFSIGIQLFLRMIKHVAKLMDQFPEYDISLHERHHNRKADAPSGTALKIAHDILDSVERKTKIYVENPDKVPVPEELYVSSERVGNVPGTHIISMDSNADSIQLVHSARNREGFASGAVKAAHWIKGKTGMYSIEDMIDELNNA